MLRENLLRDFFEIFQFYEILPKVSSQLSTRAQLVYTDFRGNNKAPFHYWWRKTALKLDKGSKYLENHCNVRIKWQCLRNNCWFLTNRHEAYWNTKFSIGNVILSTAHIKIFHLKLGSSIYENLCRYWGFGHIY